MEEEEQLAILLQILALRQPQFESTHRCKGTMFVIFRQREIENDNGLNPNNGNKELITVVRDEPSRR